MQIKQKKMFDASVSRINRDNPTPFALKELKMQSKFVYNELSERERIFVDTYQDAANMNLGLHKLSGHWNLDLIVTLEINRNNELMRHNEVSVMELFEHLTPYELFFSCVVAIQNSINKTKLLNQDLIVFRGYKPLDIPDSLALPSYKYQIGQRIINWSFVSTTVSLSTAIEGEVESFIDKGKCCLFKIYIPANKYHLLSLVPWKSGQEEVLLPAGLIFEVTGIQDEVYEYEDSKSSHLKTVKVPTTSLVVVGVYDPVVSEEIFRSQEKRQKKICNRIGCKNAAELSCSQCRKFTYCSEICARYDWQTGEHERLCKK